MEDWRLRVAGRQVGGKQKGSERPISSSPKTPTGKCKTHDFPKTHRESIQEFLSVFTRPLKPTSSPAPSHADVYQTGNAVPPWWWFMTCILEPLWPIKCQERVWSSHQTFLKRTATSSKWLQSIQRSNSSKTFHLISREAVVRSSKRLTKNIARFIFCFLIPRTRR